MIVLSNLAKRNNIFEPDDTHYRQRANNIILYIGDDRAAHLTICIIKYKIYRSAHQHSSTLCAAIDIEHGVILCQILWTVLIVHA